MNEFNQIPPEARQELIKEEINRVLPAELSGYFEATEQKHFDPKKAAGSLFTEIKTLRELLQKAIEQRGNLDGDDREKLIELGVAPEALMAQCRYLKVEAKVIKMGRRNCFTESRVSDEDGNVIAMGLITKAIVPFMKFKEILKNETI